MSNKTDVHDFEVTAVEASDEAADDRLAVILTDVRGGKVRLHLTEDLAEMLREQVSMSLSKRQGP